MPMKSLMLCVLALSSAGAAMAAPDDLADSVPSSSYFTQAPSTAIPEGSSWYTSAELGAITTSGNTEGTSVTGKIDARHEMANWSNEYIFSGYFKEDVNHHDDGTTTRTRSAERYSLSAKAAFKLLEDGNRAFLLGSHVNDKFGAYTRYSSVGGEGRARQAHLFVGGRRLWHPAAAARRQVGRCRAGPGLFPRRERGR